MIRLGMLDPPEMVPYTKIKGDGEAWQTGDHRAVAKRAAQKSIVLLKNADHFLPLDKSKLKSIAVIGPRAGPGAPGLVQRYAAVHDHAARRALKTRSAPASPLTMPATTKTTLL